MLQIYVGAAAGVCVSIEWHSLYMRFCVSYRDLRSTPTGCFNLSRMICSHPLMKWIGLRDYSSECDANVPLLSHHRHRALNLGAKCTVPNALAAVVL